MATVLIIGASRGIGLETVKAALKAGHSVRALARSARRIRIDHPKLEKMAGDALEMATVKRALTGVDAIIQSLGVSVGPEIILKPTRLFSKATRVLVAAMEEAHVKRLICVTGFSGQAISPSPEGNRICRGRERGDRLSMGRWSNGSAAGAGRQIGSAACRPAHRHRGCRFVGGPGGNHDDLYRFPGRTRPLR